MDRKIVAFVLVCLFLQLTSAGDQKWEVINENTQDNERATQQEILSDEELIPFKAPKPKPKAVVIKEHILASKKTATLTETKRQESNLRSGWRVQDRSEFGSEELLPLGVPHLNQRRLLQVNPTPGPKLPPEVEIRRLLQKNGLANLSAPCKEDDDSDCLFNVEDFLALQASLLEKNREFDLEREEELEVKLPQQEQKHGIEKRHVNDNEDDDEGDDDNIIENEMFKTLARHKRQATENTPEEGSGTGDIYTSEDVQTNDGLYSVTSTLGIDYNDTSINDTEKERYRQAIQSDLEATLQAQNFSGFAGVTVGTPKLNANGTLEFNFTITINGQDAASSAQQQGITNLEDFIYNTLQDSIVPAINNLDVFGSKLNQNYALNTGYVDELRTILNDYCHTVNPCANAGPEYNRSACVNNGFMSGICLHRCSNYPCQNGAICELDLNFNPFCNCGDRFTGPFCEEAAQESTGLTTGETVGVGVAATVAVLGSIGLCCYLAAFRRSNGDVNYSYYEDEGSQDQLSDPTIPSYYIDRPVFSPDPMAVFYADAGFDA